MKRKRSRITPKKTTAKELYDRFFPGFLNSTSVRVPESSRWSMETISQNAKLAKRYLEEIYDKINLPPEEAEGDLLWRLLFLAAKSEDQFGKLINLNGQFMEYVEQHHGISVPALGGAEPVMPGIGQRMDRSGALPQGFCRISRFSHITPDGRHVGHAAVHRWVSDCDGVNADIFRMVSG